MDAASSSSRLQRVFLDISIPGYSGICPEQVNFFEEAKNKGLLKYDIVGDASGLKPGDLLVTRRPQHWDGYTRATVVEPNHVCWLIELERAMHSAATASSSRRQRVYLDRAVRGVWEDQATIFHQFKKNGLLQCDFVTDPTALKPGDLLVTMRSEFWEGTLATIVQPNYIAWLASRAKGSKDDWSQQPYEPAIDKVTAEADAKRAAAKLELSAAIESHAVAEQAYTQAREVFKKAAANLAKAKKALEKLDLPVSKITRRRVRRRVAPGELWRAKDFWREALTREAKKNIRLYVKRESDNDNAIKILNKAYQDRALPAFFFVDVSDWLWSIKEDGYLVKLTRDGNGKWSMCTRTDKPLKPPARFLHGLQQNKELPNLMVGELITDFLCCALEDQNDADQRTVLRNKQFSILNKVFRGGPDAWYGLRIKIFAFPGSDLTMKDSYDFYCGVLAKTLQHHRHIGMCRFHTLRSTEQAIEIFNNVVQSGLEGIVIVKDDVPYGTLLDSHDAEAQYIFKLKQKIVLPGMMIKQGEEIVVQKDGIDVPEFEYIVHAADGTCVKFTDAQNRPTGSWSRLKYMEWVPGMGNTFPCQSGFRHMHFATDYDMTVEVPLRQDPSAPVLHARWSDGYNLFNPAPFPPPKPAGALGQPRAQPAVIIEDSNVAHVYNIFPA